MYVFVNRVLDWPKRPSVLIFHKIKDTFFFIFTNNYWFGYFEDVGCLPHGIIWLFSINVSVCYLSTSTGLPDCGALSSEKSPAWNFTNHFWHIRSVTAPSPYTAQTIFVFQLYFYLSWNNKAEYAGNTEYFLPSAILKWNTKYILKF